MGCGASKSGGPRATRGKKKPAGPTTSPDPSPTSSPAKPNPPSDGAKATPPSPPLPVSVRPASGSGVAVNPGAPPPSPPPVPTASSTDSSSISPISTSISRVSTSTTTTTTNTATSRSGRGSGPAGAVVGADDGSKAGSPQVAKEGLQEQQQKQQLGLQEPEAQHQQQPVEVWHCAVSLAFLQRFAAEVVQPGWTTYDILKNVVLPATSESKCRYVDTLPASDSSTLTYFISYAWSMPFASLVALLSHHLHSADPHKVFCWVDVLAINQHPGRQQSRDLQDLEEAVRLAQGTLVCLDPACVPFSRIWCLFEWWTTLRMRGLQQLVFLMDPSTRRRLGELYQAIDVRNAQATVESDRDRILAAIGEDLDLVNAQLKLLFLLEPYDTGAAAAGAGATMVAVPAAAAAAAAAASSGGGSGSGGTEDGAPGAQLQGGADWMREAIDRWLALPPEDEHYRSLALVGPVGCGKSHAVAAAVAALTSGQAPSSSSSSGDAPGAGDAASKVAGGAVNPPEQPAPPTTETGSAGAAEAAAVPPPQLLRRRGVAAHFCRAGDDSSQDPLVMVRSLAFQLACLNHGSFATFLQKKYLGLSREAISNLARLDTAFNSLLLHPLNELLPPPPPEDAPPQPAWLLKQLEAAAAAAPEEVVLVVEGVDEAEVREGQLHDNRILLALRDLFPQLPPRVRLLVSTRPQPHHIPRSLASKLHPWTASPATPPPPPPLPSPPSSSSPSPVAIATSTTSQATAVPPVPRNFVLETVRRLLPPGSIPHAANTEANTSTSTSLAAAYAGLFTAGLRPLSGPQRAGVGALLELLLASPEPPTLHVITQLGLAGYLEDLPGWGAAFHTRRGYRLRVMHRSLLEWLAGSDVDGGATAAAAHSAGSPHSAAAVLGAAGVRVAPGRGHQRLADWVLRDLRSGRRPQAYSLRYALYHLAHSSTSSSRDGDRDGSSSGGAGDKGAPRSGASAGGAASRPGSSSGSAASLSKQPQPPRPPSSSSSPPPPPSSSLAATAAAEAAAAPASSSSSRFARQLDELLLDLAFWRQVYTSRLAAGVLRDLLTLPGLDSPAARDVIRWIQRDHAALERDPDSVVNLAFETPLGTATRRAAAAAAPAVAPAGPCARPAATGATTAAAPCAVAAPVYPAWPACVAVVESEAGKYNRTAGLFAVRLAPDGRTFAAANNAGTVVVHDIASGQRVLRLRGHIDFVQDVAYVPQRAGAGGRGSAQAAGPRRAAFLVTGGSDRTVRLWDPITGDELACLQHHQRQLTAVAASPDGSLLASTDEDGAVCLWRVADGAGANGAEARPARGRHSDAAFCCTFVPPHGALLATGGKDGCVRFWDVASGEQVAQLDVPSTPAGDSGTPGAASAAAADGRPLMVKCVAFTADGATMFTGLSTGDICVWGNLAGGVAGPAATAPVPSTSSSPGAVAARGAPGKPSTPVKGSAASPSPASPASPASSSPGGAAKAAAMPAKGSASSDGSPGASNKGAATPAGKDPVASVSAASARSSPGGASSNTATPAVTAGRVPLPSWSLRTRLRGHTRDVGNVAVAAEGRTAFSAGYDNTVRVWDVAAGTQLAVLSGHSDYAVDCDLSRDGRHLVSAGSDGTVRIWDASLAAAAPPPQQHALGIMQMAVAPANGFVATASKDNTVCLWSLPLPQQPQPQQQQQQQQEEQGAAAATKVSGEPGRERRASARQDSGTEPGSTSVKGSPSKQQGQGKEQQGQGRPEEPAWDYGRLGLLAKLTGHTSTVSSVAVAPDEVTLASASYDGTVRVYRLDQPDTPELELSSGRKGFVTAVSFDAWTTRLASGASDGSVVFWDAAAIQQAHFGGGSGTAAADHGGGSATTAGWRQPLHVESVQGVTTTWGLAYSPVDYLVAGGHNSMAITIMDGLQPGQPRPEPGSGSGVLLAVYQPEDGGSGEGEGGGGYNGHVYGVGWSPDGRWLAGGYSGHRGGRARVWDVTSGKQIADIAAHEKDVWAVSFDPTNANVLASCSYDGTAAIWNLSDLRSPQRIATLRGHQGSLRSIAFVCQKNAEGATGAATAAAVGGSGGVAGSRPDSSASASRRGEGSGGAGSAQAAAGAASAEAVGSASADMRRFVVTAGTDATVRVWSYEEVLRQRDVSYVSPWALTG